MNSEELEQSLRAEFENYLKSVLAEMREETVEFKKKIEAEFDEQKSHFDLAFQAFSARFENEHEFDIGFTETVTEHLRLARDEGSQIAANAFVEAEELEKASSPPVSFAEINAAIADISSKDSQSTILKSLIEHAAEYTPRGAFFIVKSDHIVGWKVFGKEGPAGETAIREIHFPISSDSILGKSVTSLSTVEGSYGTYSDDSAFLEALEFGRPDRMYAIPLMARGRGVAVLYADYGSEGVMLNTDALEALVRVAGMTVELLASSKAVRTVQESSVPAENDAEENEGFALNPTANYGADEIASAIPSSGYEYKPTEQVSEESFDRIDGTSDEDTIVEEVAKEVDEPASEASVPNELGPEIDEPGVSYGDLSETEDAIREPAAETSDFAFVDSTTEHGDFVPETFQKQGETEPVTETYGSFSPSREDNGFERVEETLTPSLNEATLADELSSYGDTVVDETPVEIAETSSEFESTSAFENLEEKAPDMMSEFEPPPFATPITENANPYEAPPFDVKTTTFEPSGIAEVAGVRFNPDPKVETVPDAVDVFAPQRTRLSDRNVDLPIDVPEEERRLHNDARRFARLLVSEIKLYNEKKVQEGREANDLYERLKEAIDRSREMYDKRVQPPVAAKFDYFHYELVNALSDGSTERLGKSYPGASV